MDKGVKLVGGGSLYQRGLPRQVLIKKGVGTV